MSTEGVRKGYYWCEGTLVDAEIAANDRNKSLHELQAALETYPKLGGLIMKQLIRYMKRSGLDSWDGSYEYREHQGYVGRCDPNGLRRKGKADTADTKKSIEKPWSQQ